jgi:Trk-type K+ transport system membrane component
MGRDFRAVELDFDSSKHAVTPSWTYRVTQFAHNFATFCWRYSWSFVGLHVALTVVCAFIWGSVFYAIENNVGANNLYDLAPCNASFPPPLGAPPCSDVNTTVAGIHYVDALFLGLSAINASGLLTVDFSAVTLASKILAMFGFLLLSCLTTPILPAAARLFVGWRAGLSNTHEYESLRLLLILIGVYFAIFLGPMVTLFAVYCAVSPEISATFIQNGINPWFGGYFMGVSSFINAGFSVFNNSVINWAPYPGILIWIIVLNLLGNVYFPVGLRLLVWTVHKLSREGSPVHYQTKTLLKHSRHYFMLLFNTRQTLFLALFWAVTYALMFFFFLAMEWNNAPLAGLDDGQRFVSALFQSTQLRNNGFNSQNLGLWSQAIVVFALFFMYIGSYPEVVATRSTAESGDANAVHASFLHLQHKPEFAAIVQHLVLQSVGFILGVWLIILVIENQSWAGSQTIPLLFELVSAFGVVGMSIGQPGTNYSYSGSLSILSKLLVMFVMLAGRHRGMPLLTDAAIHVRLRPFSSTHIHALQIPDTHRVFETKESTSNLGQNYTLEGEAIPAHYTRPIHPVIQSHDHAAAVAAVHVGTAPDVIGSIQLGAEDD